MSDVGTKRPVQEIVEEELGGLLATAYQVNAIQVEAANFTDGFRDPNKADRPVLWDVVDYHEIPRDFFELCLKVAGYEVRL